MLRRVWVTSCMTVYFPYLKKKIMLNRLQQLALRFSLSVNISYNSWNSGLLLCERRRSENPSAIGQFCAVCLQDTDVVVWELSPPGVCLFVYYPTLNTPAPLTPFSEDSQAERKLKESQAWSADRIEQPKSGGERIFSCDQQPHITSHWNQFDFFPNDWWPESLLLPP